MLFTDQLEVPLSGSASSSVTSTNLEEGQAVCTDCDVGGDVEEAEGSCLAFGADAGTCTAMLTGKALNAVSSRIVKGIVLAIIDDEGIDRACGAVGSSRCIRVLSCRAYQAVA